MKKVKKLLIVIMVLCFSLLVVNPTTVNAETGKVSTSSIEAWKFIGGWGVSTSYVENGVKAVIPGASNPEVGTGNAWSYKATINNDASVSREFSIANGETVELEFSLGLFDSDGNVISKSQNSSAIDIIIYDANNVVGDTGLAILRIWTDGWGALNGAHPSVLYANGWGLGVTPEQAISGDATLSSSFKIAFNKENLIMAKVHGQEEMVRLDDANNTYLNGAKNLFEDVDSLVFKIAGENGFTNDTEVVIRSLNGQSLANTDGYFTDNVKPEFLDSTVKTSLSLNEEYTIPTEAYDLFGGVTYSLKIGEEVIDGKTFTATTADQMNVTLVAKDLAGNEATKDYTFEVSAFEEPYVAAVPHDAWKYIGGWGITTTHTAQGVEAVIPGASTVGAGNAWSYKATINNDSSVSGAFSIANSSTVTLEFAVGFYDSEGNVLSESQNGGCIDIVIYDAKDVNGDTGLAILRIWTNGWGNLNGSHPVELYTNGWGTQVSVSKAILGDATLDSSFIFSFDKENLLMAKVHGQDDMARLDDDSNTFLNAAKEKFANVDSLVFKVAGNNGFTNDTKVVIKSINGQTLASENGAILDETAPTILDANVAAQLTVGDVYQLPVTASDLCSTVEYSLRIGNKTYNGRTFKAEEVGELTVTLVAKDAAGNEATKDYVFNVVSNIAAPELTEVPTFENKSVLYFDKLTFAKPTFTDETGTAVTVLKVYKGEELVATLEESSKQTFNYTISPQFVSGEYTFVYEVTNAGGTATSEPQTVTIDVEQLNVPEFVGAHSNVVADYVDAGIRVRTTSNWTQTSFGVFDINYGVDVKFIINKAASNGLENGEGHCVNFFLINVDNPEYRIMYRVWCKYGEAESDAPTNVYISYNGVDFTDITDTGWISTNVDGVRGQYHMAYDPEETLVGERTAGMQRVDRAYEQLVAFFEQAPSSKFEVRFECGNLGSLAYFEYIVSEINGQSFANTNGTLNEVKDAVLEVENLPTMVQKDENVVFDLYAKDIFADVSAVVTLEKPDGTTVDLAVVDGKVTYQFNDLGNYKLVAKVTGTNGNEVTKEFSIVCKSSVAEVTVTLPDGYNSNYAIGEQLTVLEATYSDNVVTKVIEMTKPDGTKVTLAVGDKFTFETSGIYVLTYIAKDNAEPNPNEKTESITINVADTTKPVVNVTVSETAKVGDSVTPTITVTDDSEYDITVTLTKPDGSLEKLASSKNYAFTVSAEGKYTLKVVVEDIYGNSETVTKEITVSSVTVEEPKPSTSGCGGSVIASVFGVLALAGVAVVLRKKREE